MWTFVTASWWYAMAAWLDRKKDFCLYVANAIEEATPGTQQPKTHLTIGDDSTSILTPPDPNWEPQAPRVAADLADRYNLDESWQEDDPDPCPKCADSGVIPDPDWGTGWGPYFDKVCDCPAGDALPDDHRLKRGSV